MKLLSTIIISTTLLAPSAFAGFEWQRGNCFQVTSRGTRIAMVNPNLCSNQNEKYNLDVGSQVMYGLCDSFPSWNVQDCRDIATGRRGLDPIDVQYCFDAYHTTSQVMSCWENLY